MHKLCSVQHPCSATALDVPALGATAAAAFPLPARAEVYEGSAPIESVDDVVKAVDTSFYDENVLASACGTVL